MPSLILPYWDRQEAANRALALLEQQYTGMDLEVIVVDDGNVIPFAIPEGCTLDIKIVRLPEKQIPMCPVTAWNLGVKYATHDLIALSCVEVLHTMPVLQELVDQVRNMGPLGYALAAAWCPDDSAWHCHSTVKTPRNPTGTGLSFCGVMHRSLFDAAGGFDESYRKGAGYEDNDFINRLLTAGARFVIRDDLVVTHPKEGASIAWGAERFAINEQIYYAKWPTELRLNSITFCCVNADNYLGRGREYVQNLYGMLVNCLPSGLAFKFVCFTDDPFEAEGIECRALPAALSGWNNKISLFKAGVFEPGERVVYLDLDTLLIGRLDRLLDYQGEFAVLRDFWRADGLGPAVMAWRGGFGEWIWDKYAKAGFPAMERGDQEWLELVFSEEAYCPNILQDLYPGLFCSFKADCAPFAPKDARVVCFHGEPRPHEAGGWAHDVWSGALTGSDVELLCNTELAAIRDNIASSSIRDIPWVEQVPAHDLEVLIVAGGPSLLDDIEDIRTRQAAGAKVFTMNATAKLMREHGIVPDMHVVIDARRTNLRFADVAKTYLASQCHPVLFDATRDATLFHIALRDWDKYIPNDRASMAVGGGNSVGLYAMSLAYVLGYRTMHLFGFDSSYRDDAHHAYPQIKNDADPRIEAHVNGRVFSTTHWMVAQVNEFKELASQLSNMGCQITTHGSGLLPFVAWQMVAMAKQQLAQAA